MKKTVLVLGGGFAGVQAAIELRKRNMFDVTLVSDRDYLFVFPISIWIPTRETTFENATVPLSAIQKHHGFTLVIDRVTEIRSRENIVLCETQRLGYDYLIVAMGAEKVTHKGGEHTLSICGKPEMTLEIRDRLDRLIERGNGKIAFGFGGNPKDKSAVRGGPAFELLFNVHELLKKKGVRDKFELTFFAPMEHPGERMGAQALRMIDSMFKSYGIAKRYGKKISAFEEGGVVFEDGSRLESDFIMFIPGNAGHSALNNSDLPLTDAGFIKIDDHCVVEGTKNVFAAGDVAALEGPAWKAKQGHLAEIMARNAVYNLEMIENGSARRRGYRRHLSIICLMDTGSSAALVYRDESRNLVVPLPIIGHWMKRAWGLYAKRSKTGHVPRLPGL